MKKEPSKEEYQQIVKNLTPKHNSLLNCTKAFVTGGTFCALGEVMKQLMMKYLDSQIQWLQLQSNIRKKDRFLVLALRFLRLQDQ